jgi:coenzyme F420-dependent glucose-6-phosphate dehydrogenase
MAEFGFSLASEEHAPEDLVRLAERGEQAGLAFACVTDHYHPWTSAQGHSSFVWSVLAAAAARTSSLRLGTGVTCPIMRIHPAVLAQAAATTARLMPGRFFFGVGTGEALNETIVGRCWPPARVRLAMLDEAIGIIRDLWTGKTVTCQGRYFQVNSARLYTVPEQPPPIIVSALAPHAADLAGRIGDGYWGTMPDASLVQRWRSAGGTGPCYGQIQVCWAEDASQARRTALRQWPNSALVGQIPRDLPTPAHIEQATSLVDEEAIGQAVVCGPEPGPILDKVRAYLDSGYDHVYFHQLGPDQEGFFRFYEQELAPGLATVAHAER